MNATCERRRDRIKVRFDSCFSYVCFVAVQMTSSLLISPGAINKFCTFSDTSTRLESLTPCKVTKCQQQDSISSDDDEYRSSRNIAISLFRRYRNFIDRGGGDNLKEFISAGVNAYALGCTDEGLRKELTNMKESGIEIEEMQTFGGVRWSPTPPVSDEIKLQWKGFCAIIANAYYLRGMAWLPVKTLQLEQMAVVGRSEEPSVVASRMRLVFSTLEVSVYSFKQLLAHNGHECSMAITGVARLGSAQLVTCQGQAWDWGHTHI
ncbi:hypothetical protein Ccrd_001167, partial [Cynara cardunculus var. scolymus]